MGSAIGGGRYHCKEKKNFSYYSRGSLFETKTWLAKGFNHKLIPNEMYHDFIAELDRIGKMLNSYINSIGHHPSEQ